MSEWETEEGIQQENNLTALSLCRVMVSNIAFQRHLSSRIIVFIYVHTYLIDHSPWGFSGPMKHNQRTTGRNNNNRLEFQLDGGEPVGYLKVQPRR